MVDDIFRSIFFNEMFKSLFQFHLNLFRGVYFSVWNSDGFDELRAPAEKMTMSM